MAATPDHIENYQCKSRLNLDILR
uniref:Uncharacterized protein n=1 Tax=Rhizophora mucronata TaxID=61149 RepID=A0A2P2K198_RHIMU